MWRGISLHAYDVVDGVYVVVRVIENEGYGHATAEEVLTYTTTVPGKGEPEAVKWARDALVAALECL